MKAASFCILALVCAFGVAPVRCLQANPIEKVLELLSGLEAKIIKEGEGAQKVYDEFAEFCDDRSKDLGFEIKTGKAEAASLQAAIDQDAAAISALGAKIEELGAAIATDEADLKAATEIRAKEAADFSASEKELTEVIDTLERAIAILEREMQKGGASMLQLHGATSLSQALAAMVQSAALSSADASRLTALVQSSQSEADDDASLGAPDPTMYEGHSGGIISTLEGLLEKAESQLAEARKTETSSLHNYEMLKQALEDEIKFATKDMDEAKANNAAASEHKATAEGDLSVTAADLAADVKTLADLHRDCMTKASEFEEATKSRGEELKALAEAKKIISEKTGGAASLTYGLAQVSLLQVRSRLSSGADLAKFEA